MIFPLLKNDSFSFSRWDSLNKPDIIYQQLFPNLKDLSDTTLPQFGEDSPVGSNLEAVDLNIPTKSIPEHPWDKIKSGEVVVPTHEWLKSRGP